MPPKRIATIHPGRVVLEEFLAPRGISVFRLARDIEVPTRRVYEIVQGQRPISADLAHRLAHYFGMSERYWLDLQARYDGQREGNRSNGYSRNQSLRYVG
jgi:antitoxin HigA-1